jgi:hypothetical protein
MIYRLNHIEDHEYHVRNVKFDVIAHTCELAHSMEFAKYMVDYDIL